MTATLPSVAACATAFVACAICCWVGPGGCWPHPDVHDAVNVYVAVPTCTPPIVNDPAPVAGLLVFVALGNGASSGPPPLPVAVPPHACPDAEKVSEVAKTPDTPMLPP